MRYRSRPALRGWPLTLFIIGCVGVLVPVTFEFFFSKRELRYAPPRPPRTTILSGLNLGSSHFQCPGCISVEIDGDEPVVIRYPAVFGENETLPLTASVRPRANEIAIARLPEGAFWRLSSAGLYVAPEQPIAVPRDQPLPMVAVWTVSPKGPGRHLLLLEVPFAREGARLVGPIETYDRREVELNHGRVSLPVTVKTWAGIDPTRLRRVQVAMQVAGFLLTLPLLYLFVELRIRGKREREDSERRERWHREVLQKLEKPPEPVLPHETRTRAGFRPPEN